MSNSITVRNADWIKDNAEIKLIRQEVFINEQGVSEDLEWDDEDKFATHCLATVNDKAVATARLQQDGQLGRMSVLKEYRNQGIGSLMLKHLINEHRKSTIKPLFLHAQTHAIKFYQRFNFITEGDEFLEAGIPHYLMKVISTKNETINT